MLGLQTIGLTFRSLLSRAKAGTFENVRNYSLRPIGRNRWLYQPERSGLLAFVRHDGSRFVLHEEFETDLGSTPRKLWGVPDLAPHDMLPSALVHDWILELHHRGADLLSFHEANRLLEEMCLSQPEPYSRWEAFAIRQACDLFGKAAWDGNS